LGNVLHLNQVQQTNFKPGFGLHIVCTIGERLLKHPV
jgi:hypothetical protein